MLGAQLPGLLTVSLALVVGFVAYGVSLSLFVIGLRHLGASRAGAYFSTAPFVGALFSLLVFTEPLGWQLPAAAGLMALGVWLHLSEQHAHQHHHPLLEHAHAHTHDAHHPHEHLPAVSGSHSHPHRHPVLNHSHEHFPDAHHRHKH